MMLQKLGLMWSWIIVWLVSVVERFHNGERINLRLQTVWNEFHRYIQIEMKACLANFFPTLNFNTMLNANQDQFTVQLGAVLSVLPFRNYCIEMMHKAKSFCKFHYTTLLLAIGLLDRALFCGLVLNNTNKELVWSTFILLSTKFNQIYPVTTRKLNTILTWENCFTVSQFAQMEGIILHQLDFNMELDNTVYSEISLLYSQQLSGGQAELEGLIRRAVLMPEKSFKYGSDTLMTALKSMLSSTTQMRLSGQAAEVKYELEQARYDCQ